MYISSSLNLISILLRKKIHFGFEWLKKIIEKQGNKYHSKRKIPVEVDDYIVELASSGRLALVISFDVQKMQQHKSWSIPSAQLYICVTSVY